MSAPTQTVSDAAPAVTVASNTPPAVTVATTDSSASAVVPATAPASTSTPAPASAPAPTPAPASQSPSKLGPPHGLPPRPGQQMGPSRISRPPRPPQSQQQQQATASSASPAVQASTNAIQASASTPAEAHAPSHTSASASATSSQSMAVSCPPEKVARRAARIASFKAKRAALKASGGATARPRPSGSRGFAWDWTPIVTPSAHVPIVSWDATSLVFSARDNALFAQAPGTDATTIVDSWEGWLDAAPVQVGWHFNDAYIYVETNVCEWHYYNSEIVGDDGDYPITKVMLVPLVRVKGRVETFRVDFYRSTGTSNNAPVTNQATNLACFATESLAVSILVSSRKVSNLYNETAVRMLQSSDEIALCALGNHDNGSWYMSSYVPDMAWFNYDGQYPLGTVADALRTGVQLDSGSQAVGAFDFTTPATGFFFLDGVNTSEGVVFTARVPVTADIVTHIEPDTLGMPLPLWMVALVALALILSIFAAMKK